MHFFSVFPDAWMTGTAELTTEETGAFWSLCCYYMAKDGWCATMMPCWAVSSN